METGLRGVAEHIIHPAVPVPECSAHDLKGERFAGHTGLPLEIHPDLPGIVYPGHDGHVGVEDKDRQGRIRLIPALVIRHHPVLLDIVPDEVVLPLPEVVLRDGLGFADEREGELPVVPWIFADRKQRLCTVLRPPDGKDGTGGGVEDKVVALVWRDQSARMGFEDPYRAPRKSHPAGFAWFSGHRERRSARASCRVEGLIR